MTESSSDLAMESAKVVRSSYRLLVAASAACLLLALSISQDNNVRTAVRNTSDLLAMLRAFAHEPPTELSDIARSSGLQRYEHSMSAALRSTPLGMSSASIDYERIEYPDPTPPTHIIRVHFAESIGHVAIGCDLDLVNNYNQTMFTRHLDNPSDHERPHDLEHTLQVRHVEQFMNSKIRIRTNDSFDLLLQSSTRGSQWDLLRTYLQRPENETYRTTNTRLENYKGHIYNKISYLRDDLGHGHIFLQYPHEITSDLSTMIYLSKISTRDFDISGFHADIAIHNLDGHASIAQVHRHLIDKSQESSPSIHLAGQTMDASIVINIGPYFLLAFSIIFCAYSMHHYIHHSSTIRSFPCMALINTMPHKLLALLSTTGLPAIAVGLLASRESDIHVTDIRIKIILPIILFCGISSVFPHLLASRIRGNR